MKLQKATLVAEGRKHVQGDVHAEGRLVAQAKSGCSGAFGQLYERHRAGVYRTTLRVLRHRQDAEDAVQRCFQRAFLNLTRFRGDSTFSTWVTRIGINEALMLLRQRRASRLCSESRHEDTDSPSILNVPDEALTPEQALAANELRAIVKQAIAELRKSVRTVIVLRELQGLTNDEIARRLGLTVTCVKSRIFFGRRWLRRRLERKLNGVRVSALS